MWPVRSSDRTTPFHGVERGSTPLLAIRSAFPFCLFLCLLRVFPKVNSSHAGLVERQLRHFWRNPNGNKLAKVVGDEIQIFRRILRVRRATDHRQSLAQIWSNFVQQFQHEIALSRRRDVNPSKKSQRYSVLNEELQVAKPVAFGGEPDQPLDIVPFCNRLTLPFRSPRLCTARKNRKSEVRAMADVKFQDGMGIA